MTRYTSEPAGTDVELKRSTVMSSSSYVSSLTKGTGHVDVTRVGRCVPCSPSEPLAPPATSLSSALPSGSLKRKWPTSGPAGPLVTVSSSTMPWKYACDALDADVPSVTPPDSSTDARTVTSGAESTLMPSVAPSYDAMTWCHAPSLYVAYVAAEADPASACRPFTLVHAMRIGPNSSSVSIVSAVMPPVRNHTPTETSPAMPRSATDGSDASWLVPSKLSARPLTPATGVSESAMPIGVPSTVTVAGSESVLVADGRVAVRPVMSPAFGYGAIGVRPSRLVGVSSACETTSIAT